MMQSHRIAQLQAALTKSGDRADIEEVLYDLERGHAQQWNTLNSTAITQIVDYKTYRSLNIWLAGGDLDEILDMLPDAEEFAKDHGCSLIEITGRRGWKRALRPFGFKEEAVVLTKEL